MMNDEKSPSGYPEATFGLSGRQPVGTREATLRLPRGYPEATLRPPHSLPKASPKSVSSGAGALGALAFHRKERRTQRAMQPGVSAGLTAPPGRARERHSTSRRFGGCRRKNAPYSKNRCQAPAFAGALTKRHSIGGQRYYGEVPMRFP